MEQEFDFKSLFIDEANERIARLYKELLALEKRQDSAEAINEIFRTAHTLKSSAALEGYNDMRDLLHEMEGVLEKIQNHKIEMNEQVVDMLFACLDGLREVVSSVKEKRAGEVDILNLVRGLQALSLGITEIKPLAIGPQRPEVKLVSSKLTSSMITRALRETERGRAFLEITVIFEKEDAMRQTKAYLVYNNCLEIGEILNVSPRMEDLESEWMPIDKLKLFALSNRPVEEIKRVIDPGGIKIIDIAMIHRDELKKILEEKRITKTERVVEELDRGEFRSSFRVESEQLNEFIYKLRELSMAYSRLSQSISDFKAADVAVLKEGISAIGNQINELAKTSLYFVSQPLNLIFKRFEGLVKYLSERKGKEISFKTSGDHLMLDKSAIDKIGEALLHIIRNSVDHGIEPPDERARLGKPKTGEITLLVQCENKDLAIQISDDGRGFDIPLIKSTAVEKGIITGEQAEKMSDKEAVDMVFKPGFSTRRDADVISGRGIGMDVAQEAITEMGGVLNCWFEKDKGVRLTIKIPLSVCQKRQREIMDVLK